MVSAELEQRPTGTMPGVGQKRALWAVCSKLLFGYVHRYCFVSVRFMGLRPRCFGCPCSAGKTQASTTSQ